MSACQLADTDIENALETLKNAIDEYMSNL
jgi:c-di-AMP phosphodiesterase-like protein